jgi:hypothetical protein
MSNRIAPNHLLLLLLLLLNSINVYGLDPCNLVRGLRLQNRAPASHTVTTTTVDTIAAMVVELLYVFCWLSCTGCTLRGCTVDAFGVSNIA